MTSETEAPHASKSETLVATQGGNILTRSRPFQKLVDKVFTACDTNKTGWISQSELYVGLLTVHITLARYAGPAACYPPSREVSDQLFEAADADNSGGISKTEFQNILAILSAQILSRMLVYYLVLILYVPWLSKKVIDATDKIPEGGFAELVAEQVISVSIFMVAIPLIWGAIDSKTESAIDKVNSTTTKTDSGATTDAEKKEN